MVTKIRNSTNVHRQAQGIEISEKQIEILARRLLPEIRQFFADEAIKKEFEEWKRKRQAVLDHCQFINNRGTGENSPPVPTDNGFSFNRFVKLTFSDRQVYTSSIENPRYVSEEIKLKISEYLKSHSEFLQNSALSRNAIDFVCSSMVKN